MKSPHQKPLSNIPHPSPLCSIVKSLTCVCVCVCLHCTLGSDDTPVGGLSPIPPITLASRWVHARPLQLNVNRKGHGFFLKKNHTLHPPHTAFSLSRAPRGPHFRPMTPTETVILSQFEINAWVRSISNGGRCKSSHFCPSFFFLFPTDIRRRLFV